MFDWLKQEFKKLEYQVIMPNLPPREKVRYPIWKREFEEIKNELEGEMIVIAHSIGNSFIIKYFQENQLDIKLYIGLAGFSDQYKTEGREDLEQAIKSLLPLPEEIEYFKNYVKEKYCIYSDNDHIVPFEILKKHVENLDGIGYMIPNIGHMGRKSKLEEMPQVLEIVRKMED